MEKIIKILFMLLITGFLLTSCGNPGPNPGTIDQSQGQSKSSGLSTAVTFHIETVAKDLLNALGENPKQDNVVSIVKSVKYAQMTIGQAADIAKEDGNTELETKLRAFDERVNKITQGDVVVDDLVSEIKNVSKGLSDLLK